MNLSLEIVKSYGFPQTTTKPDWDDVQLNITLPNGLELSMLTVCCNEPTNCDSLEGLDGFIYITTKEELDELIGMTYEEVLNNVASDNEDFNINEYL